MLQIAINATVPARNDRYGRWSALTPDWTDGISTVIIVLTLIYLHFCFNTSFKQQPTAANDLKEQPTFITANDSKKQSTFETAIKGFPLVILMGLLFWIWLGADLYIFLIVIAFKFGVGLVGQFIILFWAAWLCVALAIINKAAWFIYRLYQASARSMYKWLQGNQPINESVNDANPDSNNDANKWTGNLLPGYGVGSIIAALIVLIVFFLMVAVTELKLEDIEALIVQVFYKALASHTRPTSLPTSIVIERISSTTTSDPEQWVTFRPKLM